MAWVFRVSHSQTFVLDSEWYYETVSWVLEILWLEVGVVYSFHTLDRCHMISLDILKLLGLLASSTIFPFVSYPLVVCILTVCPPLSWAKGLALLSECFFLMFLRCFSLDVTCFTIMGLSCLPMTGSLLLVCLDISLWLGDPRAFVAAVFLQLSSAR